MSKIRYSKVISFSSVFGALALMFSISGLSTVFFYPPAPFLKFDISEVIDVLAFFLGGYAIGLTTTFIHMLGLFFMGVDVPIGPPLKFLAIVSMFPGFYLGRLIGRKYGMSLRKADLIGFFVAVNLRWIVMSLANVIILLYVAPQYLMFFMPRDAQGAIETPDIVLQALFIAIGIIASYNVIHAIFTILISAAIYGIVRRYIKV